MGFFNFFKKKNEELPADGSLENITVENGLVLPKAFADHWDEIKKTAIEYVEIKATPSNDIKRTESSFGYYPFIPIGFNYPVDKDGAPMIPLAQLNFAEIPPLKDYPVQGILQFYIASDDCYGLDFNNAFNPDSFRVIYIENPDQLTVDPNTSFLDELISSENSPVDKPHKLTFSKKLDYVGMNDYRYELGDFSIDNIIEQYPANIKHKLQNIAFTIFGTTGHKIGGYAYFTQTDPRDYGNGKENSLLLFQMDSDDAILWGDVGVGNFFIAPNDLANKDFTKVMYNWDCS